MLSISNSSSPHIVVNTRFLIKDKLEGIGRFTFESLRLLTTNHPECRFTFLFDRPFASDFLFAPNVQGRCVFPPARHPFLWYWWFEHSLPRVLSHLRPDAFVSTDGYCSLRCSIPTLTVIHDLAFEHYPEQIPLLVRKYYKYFVPRYARHSTRIAAVSQYTKNDIVTRYGVDAQKIDVVYNGISQAYRPLDDAKRQQIQQQYAQGNAYFLFVGAIHPRKNLANILRAYDLFKKQTQSGVKMVVAGRQAWQSSEAFEVYNQMQHQTDVLFLGHLQIEELALVTGAALALVYTSLFEGFGIPIVEAMACDVPVISSNISSMPEVAGNAALLVPPNEPQAIAHAMQNIWHDIILRQTLISKAQQQRKKFSWQQTAEQLWQSIEKTIN